MHHLEVIGLLAARYSAIYYQATFQQTLTTKYLRLKKFTIIITTKVEIFFFKSLWFLFDTWNVIQELLLAPMQLPPSTITTTTILKALFLVFMISSLSLFFALISIYLYGFDLLTSVSVHVKTGSWCRRQLHLQKAFTLLHEL